MAAEARLEKSSSMVLSGSTNLQISLNPTESVWRICNVSVAGANPQILTRLIEYSWSKQKVIDTRY